MSLIAFGELRYGANRSANAIKALETIEQLATAIPIVTPGPRRQTFLTGPG